MHVKIKFVFFVCCTKIAIAGDGTKNGANTKNQEGTSTKIADSLGSTKSNLTEANVNDFAKIRYQPGFIDHSLLIEAVMKNMYSRILLVAPRRTGKSVNISMLKRFFEILPDEPALRANRKLFMGLEIMKNKAFVRKHFGNHPVIYMDFKAVRPVHSLNDSFQLVRDIVHVAYKNHMYLQTSGKLEDEQQEDVKNWSDDYKYLSAATTIDKTLKALENLAEYLVKHFDKKVFVLVDEYDSMWSDYVKNIANTECISVDDRKKLKDIIGLCTGSLFCLLKGSNTKVARGILTGISSLKPTFYSGGHSGLSNVIWYKFPENRRYAQFFRNYSKRNVTTTENRREVKKASKMNQNKTATVKEGIKKSQKKSQKESQGKSQKKNQKKNKKKDKKKS